jgi:hypothetical protein
MNTFLDNNVAASLYSGIFSGPAGHASVNLLPSVLRTWVLQNHPTTTHVRIGPVCGGSGTMEWWIGGLMDGSAWHDFITTRSE